MSDRLSIRLAKVEEFSVLKELRERSSLAEAENREALLTLPDAFEIPRDAIQDDRVFVAERQQQILGFASVSPRIDDGCEITGLFVDPDVWRGGIGKLLVTRCCSYTKEQGGSLLYSVGNRQSMPFYEACGFEQIDTFETDLGTAFQWRLEIQRLL